MSNKAKPDVKITLDRERILRLDLNAMAAFEEVTGMNLFDGTFDGSSMGARALRAMLWACLLHEDSELTLEQVGKWIAPDNMLDIANSLNEAFEVSTSTIKTEEEKGSAPDPLASLTG